MKFNELNTLKQTRPTRVGRGISAGKGKTAGRGTKGQNSRTGGGVRLGFEGGQNPLMQRLPKLPGFKSIRKKAEVVYTGQLDDIGTEITNQILFDKGLTSDVYVNVKLIFKGAISKKHTVKLQGASKSAIESLEASGGSFSKIDRLKKPKKENTTK